MKRWIIAVVLLFTTSEAFALSGEGINALVPKIIAAESSGIEKSVGDNGKARGLMQIQHATWDAFSSYPWDDAYNGDKNIQVGMMILETINDSYAKHGINATEKHLIYTYNTGKYAFHGIPRWTKNHPNEIYREIFNAA